MRWGHLYIKKHGAPRNLRYALPVTEAFALADGMTSLEAVSLAFTYGQAKGYRMAKREARE